MLKRGIAEHPWWYPTLTKDSSFEDVQMALHIEPKFSGECPKPCAAQESDPPPRTMAQATPSPAFFVPSMDEILAWDPLAGCEQRVSIAIAMLWRVCLSTGTTGHRKTWVHVQMSAPTIQIACLSVFLCQ